MNSLFVWTMVVVGIVFAVGWLRLSRASTAPAGFASYILTFPREVSADAVVSAVRSFGGLLPSWWRRLLFPMPAVVLETEASQDGLVHRLMVAPRHSAFVIGQLRVAIPGLRIATSDARDLRLSLAGSLRLQRRMLLRTDVPAEASAALLAALGVVRENEVAVVQWVVQPTIPVAGTEDGRWPPARWREMLRGNRTSPRPQLDDVMKKKLSEPLFATSGRVGVWADRLRSRMILRMVGGAFHVLNAPTGHLRRGWARSRVVGRRIQRRVVPVIQGRSLLNASEVASVIGWPIGAPSVEGLPAAPCRALPPAPLIPRTGLIFADSNFHSGSRPLALPFEDVPTHGVLVGKTGSGKTTTAVNLVVQGIENGLAVVFIDPAGDSIPDLLEQIPGEREADVILFDPLDADRPLPLNPLAASERDAELVADDLVALLRKTYANSWGPRLEEALREGLLLCARAGLTVAEVPLMFTSPAARRAALERAGDENGLRGFWAWLESLSGGELSQLTSPILNKVRPLVSRSRIRNSMGQADATFTIDEVLNDRKILLVNAAKGVLGQDGSTLIGGTVLSMVWSATLARARLTPEKRSPALIVVDELANFVDQRSAATSLPEMLAEARKFNVGIVMAAQSLVAMPRDVRMAILANARSKFAFSVGAEDAKLLAREFAPLEAEELQGLGKYELAAALTVHGAGMPTVTGRSRPLPTPSGRGGAIRSMSRQRYGRDRADVESAIRSRQATKARQVDLGEGPRR